MRARHYHPRLGRFLQPDPIGVAGGANLYAYANNNPLRWFDSWGLMPETAEEALRPPRKLVLVNFVDPTGRAPIPTATTVNPIGKSPGVDLVNGDVTRRDKSDC